MLNKTLGDRVITTHCDQIPCHCAAVLHNAAELFIDRAALQSLP